MLTTETATGVLQVSNRFRSQSMINLLQAVVTGLLILYAAVTHSGIVVVTLAYLAGKLIAGIGPIWLAGRTLKQTLGEGWWKASFKNSPTPI